MKAVFVAVGLALSDAADPLKVLAELDPITKQVAATLEDALEQSNIETPWRHLEEFKEIRRLQEGGLPFDTTGVKGTSAAVTITLDLPATCKIACPNLEKTMMNVLKDEMRINSKYGGNLGQVLANVKDTHQLILKMRPMIEDLYFLALKTMCAGRKSYECMRSNSDKCKWARAGKWSKDNAQELAPVLECICDKCPTAKDAFIKLQATQIATLYSALAELAAFFKGGPPMPASLKKKYEKETFAAMCPMVGAKLCFDANPAECSKMNAEVLKSFKVLDPQTIVSGVEAIKGQCTAKGVSTDPESVKLVGEIASNTMPVGMSGTVAALACALLFLQ